MIELSTRPCVFVVVAVLAAGAPLAAPPASAGLGDTLENVRDAVGCSTKAVLNPLRVVDWGLKNFERLSGKEYDRLADSTTREALNECLEAAENIYARGFGVEGVIDSIRDRAESVESVRGVASKISKWFGKDAETPNDRRMALSVAAREREFYEKETGVLDRKPLPAAGQWDRLDDLSDLIDKMVQGGADSANTWDDAARDPWGPATSSDSDAWEQDDPAPSPDEGGGAGSIELPPDGGAEDTSYAAALSDVLGDPADGDAPEEDYRSALAALEQRIVDEREAQRPPEPDVEYGKQEEAHPDTQQVHVAPAIELPSPDDCVTFELLNCRVDGSDCDAKFLKRTNNCPRSVIIYAVNEVAWARDHIWLYPEFSNEHMGYLVYDSGITKDGFGVPRGEAPPKWWACAEYYPQDVHLAAGFPTCKQSGVPKYLWECIDKQAPEGTPGGGFPKEQCRKD